MKGTPNILRVEEIPLVLPPSMSLIPLFPGNSCMNLGSNDSVSSESPHVPKTSRDGNGSPKGGTKFCYFLSFSLLLCAPDMDTVTVSDTVSDSKCMAE